MSSAESFFADRGKVKNPRKQSASKKIPVDELFVNALPIKSPKKGRRGNAYRHTQSGARADLPDVLPRSAWESNCIRALNLYKIKWQFEPREFEFPPTQSGRRHIYIPDIFLPSTNEYIEVKGYLDSRGRNKLRKFKKHYPDEFKELIVVISKTNKANRVFFNKLGVKDIIFYEDIIDLCAHKIVNWEGKK